MAKPAGTSSDTIHDETLFQTLIGTAVDGIIVIDEQGSVQVYNRACERLFQYHPDEVIGRNVQMLMPELYQGEHDGYLSRFRDTSERRIIGIGREVVARRKDGTTFPMYLSVGEGSSSGKRIFVGIIHDLSTSKADIASREGALRHMASIVESSSDAILSKSLDGTVLSWNSAAEHILGYSAQDIIGRKITLLFPPERLVEEIDILEKVGNGETTAPYDTVRRRKDGVDIDVSVTVSPLRDGQGNVTGASTMLRDVTSRKLNDTRILALQAELVHVTRLTAMGQLSSALAHELNQPLTAIMNYVNAARRMLEPLSDREATTASESLEKAAGQIARAGQIIRRLRDFVEKREPNRAAHDINAIAEDAIALGLVGILDTNVKLRKRFARRLDPVFADKVQIQQVMINLMRNAIEAMHDSAKRELTVTTEESTNLNCIEVSVADTGPGVPDEVAARLFEPFFTTKSQGMGVGLMICRSIVEAHEGRLWLTPNKGGGSAFHFRLPTATFVENENGG